MITSQETFFKGPDSKSYRLCRLCGLCGSDLILLFYCESRHGQSTNEWAQLYCNNSLTTEIGHRPYLPCGI